MGERVLKFRPPDRPRAEIDYFNGKWTIVCHEPTCVAYDSAKDDGFGKCLNPEAVIQDDCPVDQYCLTYKPKPHLISEGQTETQ